MAGKDESRIYVAPFDAVRSSRSLTGERKGWRLDASWSPDGRRLPLVVITPWRARRRSRHSFVDLKTARISVCRSTECGLLPGRPTATHAVYCRLGGRVTLTIPNGSNLSNLRSSPAQGESLCFIRWGGDRGWWRWRWRDRKPERASGSESSKPCEGSDAGTVRLLRELSERSP